MIALTRIISRDGSDFRLKYVIGKNDEYIDDEKIIHEKRKINQLRIGLRLPFIEGGHNIESSTLKKLI